jgi:hypothetical protein
MISPAGCGGICVQAAFKNKYCFDMPVSAEHMPAKIRFIPPGAAPPPENAGSSGRLEAKRPESLTTPSFLGATDVSVPMRTGGCNTAIFIIL